MQRSGVKWVRMEVVGREVVMMEEVELAAEEEERKKIGRGGKKRRRRYRGGVKRWRLVLGDKDMR